MQNLIRRGNAWSARFFVPKDRWSDVGKATRAANGIKKEVVRALGTPDRKEAKKRLQPGLAAIQQEVDAALIAAGLPPLTDWTANWSSRAVELRAEMKAADDTQWVTCNVVQTQDGEEVDVGETERDLLREAVYAEAQRLGAVRGPAVAQAFIKTATTEHLTIREGMEAWLAEAARGVKRKTIAGHRTVFANLEEFLREKHSYQSLASMTFADVSRRMAGEFITHRLKEVSAAAVKREASAPMGLWRWAIRRGHAELNPWSDQTAGLEDARQPDGEDDKRPFDSAELVILLRATGAMWAPNKGGYGATLWDATRLSLLTGMRAGELADLRIRDLVENGKVIFVPRGKTDNARRYVPLPTMARELIELRIAELPNKAPDAPLWPEIPVQELTASRGPKLSDKFRLARPRLLPKSDNVDFHSLRRSYTTALESAMHAGGRVNAVLIASLLGQQRGTIGLDLYSGGASLEALRNAVADLEADGFALEVRKALAETMDQRPPMVRFGPARSLSGPAKVAA